MKKDFYKKIFIIGIVFGLFVGSTNIAFSEDLTNEDCARHNMVLYQGVCMIPPTCEADEQLNSTQTDCEPKPTTVQPGCDTINEEMVDGKCVNKNPTIYEPLAPIPGTGLSGQIDTQKSPANPCPFGNYLNTLIKIIIGFAAVLAMVRIVIGGIEYMTTEAVSEKSESKSNIMNAILGLVLALGSFAILNTINPELLNVCLDQKLKEVSIEIFPGESFEPFQSIDQGKLGSLGIYCPGTGGKSTIPQIARSFIGNATYSMEKRNGFDENKKTAFFDCSSYVAQVYSCAGLPLPGNTTASIFSNEVIKVEGTQVGGVELRVGDLLGWKAGESGKKFGHVVMYIGNGQIINVHGPKDKLNQATTQESLASYDHLNSIIHIRRAP